MTLDEAKAECARWFANLDRDRQKTKALQELAADRRAGRCDAEEARRRMNVIDGGCGVTVYDGANLERAVRCLLKHV